ncbi:MAG: 50S ribosomal protein L24 [Candidatus Magasanikbacteria bacterium CG11_big_fil_rev_8_21_14_0_20_39_34]|uniref:Large ribosomal subunit protein uL24 n=1 Tax=Candidatus Magasanikbacteria bacterium CG11_big_fil_rev_8_21_14_0_20_39_34 TaxID=1974653 RepID=A0A2H0N3V1_9BACT|nr:MAG: 50S ribosomal protein L24 [Candidatus Magasanikbacteria bacterium CG11_big_fil_rev_8_21_14_0_20_39_34]
MKIKTGDKVKVISGKEKGKTGKVIQVIVHAEKGRTFVIVEGLNIIKRHLKTRRAGEKGQILELAGPMDISNVMLVDPKSNKSTRVGYKHEGKTKKRLAKVNGELLD